MTIRRRRFSAAAFFSAAAAFAAYDIFLLVSSPGTVSAVLTSFSHIWLLPAAFCILCGCCRLRGVYFLYALPRFWRFAFFAAVSAGVLVGAVCLFLILTPETEPLSRKKNAKEGIRWMILFGGGIDKNGNLPPLVLRRAETAAAWLRTHPASSVVVTGGTLRHVPHPEAPAMKRSLEKAGIAPERILPEDRALDTIQNLRYSAMCIARQEQTSLENVMDSCIAVLSSRYHLARIEILARRLGFSCITVVPAPVPLLYAPHAYLREICAFIKLGLRIALTGEPAPMRSLGVPENL